VEAYGIWIHALLHKRSRKQCSCSFSCTPPLILIHSIQQPLKFTLTIQPMIQLVMHNCCYNYTVNIMREINGHKDMLDIQPNPFRWYFFNAKLVQSQWLHKVDKFRTKCTHKRKLWWCWSLLGLTVNNLTVLGVKALAMNITLLCTRCFVNQ